MLHTGLALKLWLYGELVKPLGGGAWRDEVTSLRAGLGRGDRDPGSLFAFLFVFRASWGEKPFYITIFHSSPRILSFSKVTDSSDQCWNLWIHELKREFVHTCVANASRTEPSPQPLPPMWTTAQEHSNVWTLHMPFNYISCNTYLGVIFHVKHLHTLLIVHSFQMCGLSFLEIVFYFWFFISLSISSCCLS